MATTSVAAIHVDRLDLERVDKAEELIAMISGIASVISSASTSHDNPLDDATPNACWAIQHLLEELKGTGITNVARVTGSA